MAIAKGIMEHRDEGGALNKAPLARKEKWLEAGDHAQLTKGGAGSN